MRINRNVGYPMAAVILLTCRFLPSDIMISNQESGTVFRTRIGGTLSQSNGGSIIVASAGRVIPSLNFNPL